MCIKDKDNNLLVKMKTLRIDKENILTNYIMENKKMLYETTIKFMQRIEKSQVKGALEKMKLNKVAESDGIRYTYCCMKMPKTNRSNLANRLFQRDREQDGEIF